MKNKIVRCIALLSIAMLTTNCASLATSQATIEKSIESKMQISATKFGDRANAETVPGQDGIYRVTLFANEYPLPLNKIHSWTAHVETAEGEIVENAKIRIHGGMPAHNHDYPTTPRVKQYLGNGDYIIEGVKFSMPGEWEMRLNIKEEAKLKRDSVLFIINL